MTSAIAALAIGALLVWLIAVVADPWRDLTADPPTGPPHVLRAEVVHVSILAPPRQLIAFLIDAHNWTKWAPWIQSVSRTSEHGWTFATAAGAMTVRFVEHNTLGVLDHEVTLPSGVTVMNSMRVVPNGSGSELVMVLFQLPDASNDEFERDIQAVREDLARIKSLSEAMALEAADDHKHSASAASLA
jgi:Polyketide cyclase / dehydrase and lipid transport